SWGGRSIDLAMGLRTGGEVHWWEACRLVEMTAVDNCTVLEMGGAIPLVEYGTDHLREYPGFTSPFLHRHNWLYGRLMVRAHANGVCEVFAHHINGKFVDEGGDLHDATPVIGLRCPEAPGA